MADTPFISALRRLTLKQLQAEMREIERQQAELNTHAQLLRLAVNMKLGESGANGAVSENGGETVDHPKHGPRARAGKVPSMRKAILLVLGEREGVWTKNAILSRMEELGWLPAVNARNQLTSRLGEMTTRGEVTRHGEGLYSLAERTPQGTLLGVGKSAE